MENLQIMMLAAGAGTRFRDHYDLPKPLIPILGIPMIAQAYNSLDIKCKSPIFVLRRDTYLQKISLTIGEHCHPNARVSVVDKLTDGPCISALSAISNLDLNAPLIIVNCDQIMDWDGAAFINYCETTNADGVIVTYHSETTKNSYAKLAPKSNQVIDVREKELISNVSLNGIHFWKKAYDFVASATSMIIEEDKVNNEYYIAPTYKHLYNKWNKRILAYPIPNHQHSAIGVPEDLERYVAKNRLN